MSARAGHHEEHHHGHQEGQHGGRHEGHGPPPGEPPGFFDKPENVRRLTLVFYVLCGLLVALDLVLERHHVHPWEYLIAFYPLYGFVGIVVLVMVAKGLRKVVMRPEDYYDAG